jgi:transcriptional regulator with XRE-family HTH domain
MASETNHPMREWRRLNEKTLQDVAKEVGCTQPHLSEIENWKNEPSLDLAARLSSLTGLDMKAFVKQTESAA